MEANVQARIDFTDKVMEGKYTRTQAEAELDRMEQEFGPLAFLPGTVAQKPKPWTMKYLKELKNDFVCGAGSREFLSHMAEVGEYVHRRLMFRKIGAALVGIAAALGAAALFWRVILWILGK